jgi:hypothetical protein
MPENFRQSVITSFHDDSGVPAGKEGAARRSALVQAIAGIWSRNDNYFERDLDALEI